MRARRFGLGLALAAAFSAFVAPAAFAQASCPTTPTYDPSVPTPESVIGFPLGRGQPIVVSTAQSDQYVEEIDAASNRVIAFNFGRSVSGQPLKAAIVSTERNVQARNLAEIARRINAMRLQRSDARANAARWAKTTPAILWLAGNVHGGETSGTDAELKVLYELASRSDCEVLAHLRNLVTVIVPIQNPDGRDDMRRQNRYGFDLNRDWFARTQPETDSKIELLRRYPGQVFVDAHEMGGRQYFFPPNADPIHHEIASEPVKWINEIGEANKQAFNYNGA